MPDFFSIMPVEIFSDDRLSKTDLRVLGTILSFRSKTTNICWPSRQKIADRCGLPLCKISTSTTRLVELGWLKKYGDGGRSKSSKYEFHVPDLNRETVTDSVTVTKPVTVTDSVTKTVTDSVRGIELTNELTNSLSIRGGVKKGGNKLSGFENFWSVYPKRKSKADAQKAWKKIEPDEQLQQTIIDAVLLATKSDQWQSDNGKYIPYPATWLNGKRWNDEVLINPQPTGHNYAAGRNKNREIDWNCEF